VTFSLQYIDTSVALRILLEQSNAATDWLAQSIEHGSYCFSSQLLRTEIYRAFWRRNKDFIDAEEFLNGIPLIDLDNDIAKEAAILEPIIKTLDALHIATAMRLSGIGPVTVVTHDAQMARAAQQLGFDVHDPVTDDPHRAPVA